MRELGMHSEREHRRVGEQVGRVRPSVFVAVGGDARFMAEAARESGVGAVHVADAAGAVGPVLEAVGDKDVILVKGSRGVALERVVRALEAWGEGQDR
jgi:UDP-N-acetylmuramyl pentapeptide synthase